MDITSGVYDYSLGQDINQIATKHACLPIWYNFDTTVVQKIISQLKASI